MCRKGRRTICGDDYHAFDGSVQCHEPFPEIAQLVVGKCILFLPLKRQSFEDAPGNDPTMIGILPFWRHLSIAPPGDRGCCSSVLVYSKSYSVSRTTTISVDL